MQNIIYAEWPKKWSKLKRAPFFGANQFVNATAGLDVRSQSKSNEGSLSISLYRTATRILLAFISRAAWQRRYNSRKVGHWRKDILEGQAPFYFIIIIFFAKDVCTINFSLTVSFSLYLNLKPREKCFFFRRWVTWSWHNFQRSNGSCFLGCVVKFPAREANSWRRYVFFFPFLTF